MTGSTSYRHTQIGWVVLVVLMALAGVFALTNPALLHGGPGLFPLLLFPGLLLLFGTLTVTVNGGELRARFGIGLIGKTLPLSEVQAVRAVRNPWIWGWGIRFFPGGTLYNVSGLDAVELQMRDGRRVRIGTDEPLALLAALRAVVREHPGDLPGHPRAPVASSPWRTATLVLVTLGVIGLLGFVAALTVLEPRPPRATVGPARFSVRSFAYSAELPLSELTAVDLQAATPRVLRRTNGFAAAGVLRGHFDVEGLGSGMMFVDMGSAPFLVARTPRTFVIVSFDDPARTRALFAELQAAWTAARPR